MAQPPVDVVHVGSASRDLAADDERGWRLGGGVTYAALTTARLGLRTAAAVGADPEAGTAHELDALRAAGVAVIAIPLAEGPVFHNVEAADGRVQTAMATGVPLPLVALPEAWSAARAWSLVPVADEVVDDWIDRVRPDALVAVAWQGMLRRLSAGERVERAAPGARRLLRRADIVGISGFDVEPSTSLGDLIGFLRPGTRLLITEAERGGMLVTTGGDGPTEALRYRPTPTERVVDSTGAGDTTLAALLATLLRPELTGRAAASDADRLGFAAAAGSLVIEGLGLAGVPDRSAVMTRWARGVAAEPVVVDPRGPPTGQR